MAPWVCRGGAVRAPFKGDAGPVRVVSSSSRAGTGAETCLHDHFTDPTNIAPRGLL